VSTDEVTVQNILDAITALGGQFTIDPFTGPEEITEEHRPDMLGFLAGLVAVGTAVMTNPRGENQGLAWRHGFLAAMGDSTEDALLAVGGTHLAEAMALGSVREPTAMTRLAAEATDLASTITMMAAATVSTDPDLALTREQQYDLLSRARRAVGRMRDAVIAAQRAVAPKRGQQ
jgi:hypothetical protein